MNQTNQPKESGNTSGWQMCDWNCWLMCVTVGGWWWGEERVTQQVVREQQLVFLSVIREGSDGKDIVILILEMVNMTFCLTSYNIYIIWFDAIKNIVSVTLIIVSLYVKCQACSLRFSFKSVFVINKEEIRIKVAMISYFLDGFLAFKSQVTVQTIDWDWRTIVRTGR